MVQKGLPQCIFCKHKKRNGYCDAFSKNQIPDDIWRNYHDHKNPYPGDNGILFEIEESKAEFYKQNQDNLTK